ncbi:uncharacterized protein LOC122298976 [Carya illinoinensis]|uniref:uncharacterized protein LOC122298976 n=1 Tax=Carya illinoinensis TaxID=32201 RepID=UPI001C728DAC|nr:uncharacterized protein LOC122298976 [Carya illinoinensis]
MADDDLTKQWEKLHLSTEETTVVQFKIEGAHTNNSIQGKLCIIGRVLSERGVNNKAFRSTMSKIWRLEGWICFKDLNEQCFLIEFQSKKDKDKVLSGRPWCFDRNLLTIQEVDESMSINVVNFQYEPFWVECYNVPLAAMNEGIGIQIGESIGRVIRVDANSDGSTWGCCLRIRVAIDLHKPLLRGRVCVRPYFEAQREEKQQLQFGPWLRAQPMNTSIFDKRKYGGNLYNINREHNVYGSKEGYS